MKLTESFKNAVNGFFFDCDIPETHRRLNGNRCIYFADYENDVEGKFTTLFKVRFSPKAKMLNVSVYPPVHVLAERAHTLDIWMRSANIVLDIGLVANWTNNRGRLAYEYEIDISKPKKYSRGLDDNIRLELVTLYIDWSIFSCDLLRLGTQLFPDLETFKYKPQKTGSKQSKLGSCNATPYYEQESHVVGISASGVKYLLHTHHFNFGCSKTLYLQAGLHGNELCGQAALLELVSEWGVGADKMPFNLLVVPQANPFSLDSQIMGIQTGYNNIHTNPKRCVNWNRCDPTQPDEHQRQLFQRLEELAGKCAYVIDIHCAGHESIPHVYSCVEDHAVERAMHFGISEILTWETPDSSFANRLYKTNTCLSYTLEVGSSRDLSRASIDAAKSYVKNFIKGDGALSAFDYAVNPKKYLIPIYARDYGLLVWEEEVGDEICKEYTIATILNSEGSHAQHSPVEGVLAIKYPCHAVYQGQEIGMMISSVKIDN